MLLLYYIFNILSAMMCIDSNHVHRAKKYWYQITTCICTILFHIESFFDCLSLQNLYHANNVFVIDE